MKKKIIAISVILVLILSAAGIAVYQNHQKKQRYNDSYVNGNTAGNLYNYGMFCEHNGTVYFSNPNDNYRLYSMNEEGEELKKLCDDSVAFINADDNYVYYVRRNANFNTTLSSFNLSTNGLCCYNLRSKKVTILDNDPSMYVSLIGNYLYYIHYNTDNASTLYRIKIDGTEQEEIDRNPYFTCSTNGRFFYFNGLTNNHNIYQMDTISKNAKLICEGNYWMPSADNEYIYFLDCEQNYALVRLGLTDETPKVIIKDRIETYNVHGDTIYFQKNNLNGDSALCSVKTDGSNYKEIKKGDYNQLNVTSNYVYFAPVGVDNLMYRFPTSNENDITEFKPE